MKKTMCWEAKHCGREPQGKNTAEFGVCPAAIPGEFNDMHGGTHQGRFCWAIAGTHCEGNPECTYSEKIETCLACDFFKQVRDEEASTFILTPQRAKFEKGSNNPDQIIHMKGCHSLCPECA